MEEDFVPITPINFFQICADCTYRTIDNEKDRTKSSKKDKEPPFLPDTSNPCFDEPFAHVRANWNEQGLYFTIIVNSPVRKIAFPDVVNGDSIELFIDTRDVKTGGFNTRFCHHFFFLPEAVEGVQSGEITRFRTEDSHPLCDPKDLKIKATLSKTGYQAEIFIPSQALCSYDPLEFNRLGFTYRINRANQSAQHLSVVSDDYQIDQNPSCWGTLRLVR